MQLPNKASRFFVIPDTHFWCKNIANRKDYVSECNRIYDSIFNFVKDNQSTKTYIVFLGDMFHGKFQDNINYIEWFQKIQVLRAVCNGIFSVVGNHEITYREQNPFWSLVSDVESDLVNQMGLIGNGDLPIIRIPDTLEIYNTQLIFNHFGTPIIKPNMVNNILFCHNYWMTKQLSDSLYRLNIAQVNNKYVKYNEICEGCSLMSFNEAFFGHNHMLIGDYRFDWDTVEYHTNAHFCGSLGLTNINEVLYTEPLRKLYYIDIDENHYTINDLKIELPKYDTETLNVAKVSENQEKYKAAKYKKSLIKKYDLTMMDPVSAIREDLSNDILTLELFDNLGRGGTPEWVTHLI